MPGVKAFFPGGNFQFYQISRIYLILLCETVLHSRVRLFTSCPKSIWWKRNASSVRAPGVLTNRRWTKKHPVEPGVKSPV